MSRLTPRRPGHGRALRRTRLIAGGMAIIALALLVPCDSLDAGIRGSEHDFSALDVRQQVCLFCHTPHDADTSVTDAPLWDHDVTVKQFQLYNSPTMDAVTQQPSGASRLCLSCHDGTVAVDSYGGSTGVIHLGGDLAIGADELVNDHPVSFPYDDALALRDDELFAPSNTPSGLGDTIREDLLFGDMLECSSCHDVHNGATAEVVNDHLLVITQDGSALCFTCHDK